MLSELPDLTDHSPKDPVEALVRMANQIAANVAHHTHEQAVAGVASHLRSFWAPSMRETLLAWVDAGGTGLDPVAREAVEATRPGSSA